MSSPSGGCKYMMYGSDHPLISLLLQHFMTIICINGGLAMHISYKEGLSKRRAVQASLKGGMFKRRDV